MLFSFAFLFFFSIIPPPPRSTLFPYTTLFRSALLHRNGYALEVPLEIESGFFEELRVIRVRKETDRKSTRLNSSHANISYAVFCLKKKKRTRWRRAAGGLE